MKRWAGKQDMETALDKTGSEVLRLGFVPRGVIVNGVKLPHSGTLNAAGGSLDPKLKLKRSDSSDVLVE